MDRVSGPTRLREFRAGMKRKRRASSRLYELARASEIYFENRRDVSGPAGSGNGRSRQRPVGGSAGVAPPPLAMRFDGAGADGVTGCRLPHSDR